MSGTMRRKSAAMPMQINDFFLLFLSTGVVSCTTAGFQSGLGAPAGFDGGVYGGGASLWWRGSWGMLEFFS
jgi:hypothetical protein